MDFDLEDKAEAAAPAEWKPTKNELLVMVSLSFISLMVALDATILVTVLPVCSQGVSGCQQLIFRRKSLTRWMEPQQRLSGRVHHSEYILTVHEALLTQQLVF